MMDFPIVNLTRGSNIILSESQLKLIFGERYGIIGRNGIGKTTLLDLIAQKNLSDKPFFFVC